MARPRLRLALIAAALATAGIVVAVTVARSPHGIRDLVDDLGAVAWLAFVPLSAALTAAFAPGWALSGSAGLLFGTLGGTPVAITAAVLAAVGCAAFTRHTGRAALDAMNHERTDRVRAWVEKRGFLGVLYLRLLPVVPFTGTSYALGLTRISLLTIAAATAIGCAPRAYAYVALGGNLDDLTSPQALASFGILASLALTGALVALVRGRALRA